MLLEAVLDTIVKEKLLSRVTQVGDEMMVGLKDLSTKYPGFVMNNDQIVEALIGFDGHKTMMSKKIYARQDCCCPMTGKNHI